MSYELVPLGELGEIVAGSTPDTSNKAYWGGDISWITPADLTSHEGIYFTGNLRKITEAGYKSCSTRMLPAGSILFSSRAPIGHCALTSFPLCTNQGFKSIIPNERLDAVYGFFALKFFTPQIEALGRGATFTEVNKEIFESIRIPIPPLPEQHRIAGLLARADRLRRLRRVGDDLSGSLLQSVFLEMFGDPIQNPRKWERTEINDLISDLRGGAPLEPEDFVENGFPVLHKGAIKPGGVIELDSGKKTFTQDTFVEKHKRSVVNHKYVAVTLRDLVPSGPSIGLISKVDKGPFQEYILAQGAYAFLVNEKRVKAEYLVWLSNIPSFRIFLRTVAVGSTQIHIRNPIFTEITIPLPPLAEQERFARVVRRVENLRARQAESGRQAEGLFQSLLHEAFNG